MLKNEMQTKQRHFFLTVLVLGIFAMASSFVLSGRSIQASCLQNQRRLTGIPQIFQRRSHVVFATDQNRCKEQRKICIVGGGLAGLSVAYHLLLKSACNITIIDKSSSPGETGASAVAGGSVHPFSPRGKLVHLGIEGLNATKSLVNVAREHAPGCVIRDSLYRVAITPKNKKDLEELSEKHPTMATWKTSQEIKTECGANSLGGVLLSNGCMIIHVPSYLRGLYKACECLPGQIKWNKSQLTNDWINEVENFDTVILAAGAGLWHDKLLNKGLPVDLVRGQSIEFRVSPKQLTPSRGHQGVLGGKYMYPLPHSDDTVLIGATHEYMDTPLPREQVLSSLRNLSYDLAPNVWDSGTVDRITQGYRVQSHRTPLGRQPILGRYHSLEEEDVWVYTGLSSRGLIYHGIYGKILADAILDHGEQWLFETYPHLSWYLQK